MIYIKRFLVKNLCKKRSRFLTVVLSLALVFNALSLALFVRPVSAGSLTVLSDTMTRQEAGTDSSHRIRFTTPSGVTQGQTIILTFESGFEDLDTAGIDFSDVDLIEDPDGAATSEPLAASATTTVWGVSAVGDVLTFTAPSDAATYIAAVAVVEIIIGTEATGGVSNDNFANSSVVSVYVIVDISGSFGDTGIIYVPVVDDDFVTITASVQSHVQFDLDINDDPSTGVHHPEDIAAYGINLGQLLFTDYTDEDDVEEIYVDFSTNASGGMIIDFYSVNTSLDSASTGGAIESGLDDTTLDTNDADTCAVGCGNYGVAAEEHGDLEDTGTLVVDATYVDPGAGSIVALPSTWDTIFSAAAAIQGGDGRVNVRAISGTQTPAADDYTDTLYFRATVTF